MKGDKTELLFIDDAAIVVTGPTFEDNHARLRQLMMGDDGIFQ